MRKMTKSYLSLFLAFLIVIGNFSSYYLIAEASEYEYDQDLKDMELEELSLSLEEIEMEAGFFREEKRGNSDYLKDGIDYLLKDQEDFDYITTLALRRAGVTTDVLQERPRIRNIESIQYDAENIINIAAMGLNPFEYDFAGKTYNYVESLQEQLLSPGRQHEYEDIKNIIKAVIAFEMVHEEYDHELIDIIKNRLVHDKDLDMMYLSPYENIDGEYTAFGIIALYLSDREANEYEISKMLNTLEYLIDEKGTIQSRPTDTALAIQALILLGEDLDSERWNSLVDGLYSLEYEDEKGRFGYTYIMTAHAIAAIGDMEAGSSMYEEYIYTGEVGEAKKLKVDIFKEEILRGEETEYRAVVLDEKNLVIRGQEIEVEAENENIVEIIGNKIKGKEIGNTEIIFRVKGTNLEERVTIEVKKYEVDRDKILFEIEFLKQKYEEGRNFESLAAPAANLAGTRSELLKENIYPISKPTGNIMYISRRIISLIGSELDPRNYSEKGVDYNYIKILENSQVEEGEFVLNESLDRESVNSLAMGIIALDMAQGKYNEESAIERLIYLMNQKGKSYEEVYTEALVLNALSRHKELEGVEAKIDELVNFIALKQTDDAGFDLVTSSGLEKNNSIILSTVIQALVANDINPLSEEWVKNNTSMFDALLKSKYIGPDLSRSGYLKAESAFGIAHPRASYSAYAALVDLYNMESMFNKLSLDLDEDFYKIVEIDLKNIKDTIYVGEILELELDLKNKDGRVLDGEVELISEDEDILEVEDRNLIAKNPGKVTVKIKLLDGDLEKNIEVEVLEELVDKDLIYEEVDDYIKITGYRKKHASNEIVIPSKISGKTVKVIAKDFVRGLDFMSGIKLPDTIEVIEENALKGQRNHPVYKGKLPKNLKEVKSGGLQHSDLSEVDSLPESLEVLGASAFESSKLKINSLPKNIKKLGYGVFAGNEIEKIDLSHIEEIGEGAFRNNKIKELRLGEGLHTIRNKAFELNSIEEVEIPDTVKNWGNRSPIFGNNRIDGKKIYTRVYNNSGATFKNTGGIVNPASIEIQKLDGYGKRLEENTTIFGLKNGEYILDYYAEGREEEDYFKIGDKISLKAAEIDGFTPVDKEVVLSKRENIVQFIYGEEIDEVEIEMAIITFDEDGKYKVKNKPEKIKVTREMEDGITPMSALKEKVNDLKINGNIIVAIDGIEGPSPDDSIGFPGGGWMYSVNGEKPDLMTDEYNLSNGDKLLFYCTYNYKEDIVPSWDELIKESEKKPEYKLEILNKLEVEVGEVVNLHVRVLKDGKEVQEEVKWIIDSENASLVGNKLVFKKPGNFDLKVVVGAYEEVVTFKVSQVEENKLIINLIEGELKNGIEFRAGVELINNKKQDQDMLLIVGLYERGSNKMVNYSLGKKKIKGNTKLKMESGFLVPEEGDYYSKTFLWDSLENQKPLIESFDLLMFN